MDDAKVWERLGELTSEAKASQNQRSALFIKMEGVESSIANLTTIVEKSIVSGDLRLDVVEEDMSSVQEDVGSLKKFRTRLYLGMAAIGGTGGVTGAIMTKLGLN